MARVYRKNELVSPLFTFKRNGALFNPTTVTVTITPPKGPQIVDVSTAGGTSILHDSTGLYVRDMILDQRGTWYVDALGVGTYVDTQGRTRQYREPIALRLRVYF